MKRVIFLVILLMSNSVFAQKLLQGDKVICPLYKIENSTVAPTPNTSFIYAINDHVYYAGTRLDSTEVGDPLYVYRIVPKPGTVAVNIRATDGSGDTLRSAYFQVWGSGIKRVAQYAGDSYSGSIRCLTTVVTPLQYYMIYQHGVSIGQKYTWDTISFYPEVGTLDLGTSAHPWNKIYARNLNLSNLAPGAVSDNIVLASSGDLKQIPVSSLSSAMGVDTNLYANITKYGAVGDGTTNCTRAFEAALNSNKRVLVPAGRFMADSIVLKDKSQLIGLGWNKSIIQLTTGKRVAIKINSVDSCIISGIKIYGGNSSKKYANNDTTTSLGRIGIDLYATKATTIKDCYIIGFTGYGVNGGDGCRANTIDNVFFKRNWCGVNYGSGFEYTTTSNLHFDANRYGVILAGANNNLENIDSQWNRCGLWAKYASNAAHSDVTTSSFNHNTKYSVYIDSVSNPGLTFSGCNFWFGGFVVKNSQNVRFSNCIIMPDSLRFTGDCTNSGFSTSTIGVTISPFTRNRSTDFSFCNDNHFNTGVLTNISLIDDMWIKSGSNLFYTGGNVGIGTSNPSYPLHIYGSANITGALYINQNQTLYGGYYPNCLSINGTTLATYPLVNINGNVGFSNTNPTENLSIGSSTAGGTVKVYATVGSEMAPVMTGNSGTNWTLSNSAGYDQPFNSTISKTGDGTGYAYPSATTTIVSGVTYRVTVNIQSLSGGSLTWTIGSTTCRSYVSVAGTYVDNVTASTTNKFSILPSVTGARFVISSISIKALTSGTGDVAISGGLMVSRPSIFESAILPSRHTSVPIGGSNYYFSAGYFATLYLGAGTISECGTLASNTTLTIKSGSTSYGINFNGGSTAYGIWTNTGLAVGNTSPTAKLHVSSDIIRLDTPKTPASGTATGNIGDICWDENYLYVCVAANTWKRAALTTIP